MEWMSGEKRNGKEKGSGGNNGEWTCERVGGWLNGCVTCVTHVHGWCRRLSPAVGVLRWWSGGAAASCGGGLPEKSPEMQFLHFPSFVRFFKAFNDNVFRR